MYYKVKEFFHLYYVTLCSFNFHIIDLLKSILRCRKSDKGKQKVKRQHEVFEMW